MGEEEWSSFFFLQRSSPPAKPAHHLEGGAAQLRRLGGGGSEAALSREKRGRDRVVQSKSNSALQIAIEKYGLGNFTFRVLEYLCNEYKPVSNK